jgi:pSer/pThr/pTyr-binding forkhead associated (FHA) protein
MTGRVGHRTTTRQEETAGSAPSQGTVYARLAYTDNDGPHTFEIAKDSIVIGRGGIAYRVDVRISSALDVSREHARIRRDPATGQFFLIDLSTLGTTLNGRHVPRGYDEVDGTKRENGSETLLPDVAKIGLAGTVFLQFRKRR